MPEANTNLNNDAQLRNYLQEKVHEITIECVNNYLLLNQYDSLFHTFLSQVFMKFRDSVATSIHIPFRNKAPQSSIHNIEKESIRLLEEKLPENYTQEDIDMLVPDVVQSICKDFLAATVVFHSKNNLSEYCEESDDPTVKQLYNQLLIVDDYLRAIERNEEKGFFSNIFGSSKYIDVSDTYIDGDLPKDKRLTRLKPMNLNNVMSREDYYKQKINLLVLLTNSSMLCTESPDGKTHKYCVGQVDVPYLQLVKQAKAMNPRNNDEFIKILTDLARENYYVPYLPFDEQLENTINEFKAAKKDSSFKSPLSVKERAKNIQELKNLQSNLKQMKNDRLLNYVLSIELPRIFDELSTLPNLHVEEISKKVRGKLNGFYASYYILKLNDVVICEVQGQSEFRSDISKDGNAAHNMMDSKSFNFRHLFEPAAFPFKNTPKAQEMLKFYCDFLETVNLNTVSGYRISKEDKTALRDLKDLVEYASSKIRVKDKVEVQPGNFISFEKYIDDILSAYGSKYGTINAAHRIEHNQALEVPQNALFSLENLLRSRVGFSCLANLIRTKYKECKTKIPPYDLAKAFSPSFSEHDINSNILEIEKAKEAYEPLDVPFHPMNGEDSDIPPYHFSDKDDDAR